MAEHGSRTMYVHYGCRCEECCRAEHRQYLKRKESISRRRTYSKWGTDEIAEPKGKITQRNHNRNRWIAFRERPSTHTRPLRWQDIADQTVLLCKICGCRLNVDDKWVGQNGRMCYGRTYPTVDHIIPLKHGGTDTMDNVQLVCKHCNSAKGARINGLSEIINGDQGRGQTGKIESTCRNISKGN